VAQEFFKKFSIIRALKNSTVLQFLLAERQMDRVSADMQTHPQRPKDTSQNLVVGNLLSEWLTSV
jgi:hypothetical protein